MIDKNYSRIMIFADDFQFRPRFVDKFKKTIKEADENVPNWELLLLESNSSGKEIPIPNSMHLFYPKHTHTIIAYVINLIGAIKLINQNPLDRLVVLNEYLSIMYDQNPDKEWSEYFQPRNLVALATGPDLIQPQIYLPEVPHISDIQTTFLVMN